MNNEQLRTQILTYRPTSVTAAPTAAHYSLFTIHYSLNFSFSAKEFDAETGLSYFGARYYSSDLSVWLSGDPMSDKYPSLSTYVYCADNPVKCVDPNGEEIYVGDNYYYRNGHLYDKLTGKVFTPDANSFEAKALNSLNKLKGTKQGSELMNPFEGETGSDVNLVDAVNRTGDKKGVSGVDKASYDSESGNFKSATIYWNPEGAMLSTTEGFRQNGTTDLGHEFSHVYDMAKKISNSKVFDFAIMVPEIRTETFPIFTPAFGNEQ